MNIRLKPRAKSDNLVVQDLADEILIYNLENNKAFALNETARLVWQSCDGKNDVGQIAASMTKKLDQNVPDDLVLLALNDLRKQNLVEPGADLPAFSASTRREVIKRAGLASMVALPVIGSMLAPKAVMAISVNCNACSMKADPCIPGCEGVLGFCWDNAGCGCGQQVLAGVSCLECKTGVMFEGGVDTGSWSADNMCHNLEL